MALLHFDTKELKLLPMADTFANHFEDPAIKDLLYKIITEQGFSDGVALDYPDSKHMLAGVGKLEPGAGIPIEEKPLPWDEVVYILEGSMTGTSEGKSYTATEGEFFFLSKGTSYAWSSETGCTVLYITYPHWWKAIQEAYEVGILEKIASEKK